MQQTLSHPRRRWPRDTPALAPASVTARAGCHSQCRRRCGRTLPSLVPTEEAAGTHTAAPVGGHATLSCRTATAARRLARSLGAGPTLPKPWRRRISALTVQSQAGSCASRRQGWDSSAGGWAEQTDKGTAGPDLQHGGWRGRWTRTACCWAAVPTRLVHCSFHLLGLPPARAVTNGAEITPLMSVLQVSKLQEASWHSSQRNALL